jgi:hypothetical protein
MPDYKENLSSYLLDRSKWLIGNFPLDVYSTAGTESGCSSIGVVMIGWL